MLSKKTITALNAQVAAEFYSAYLYLGMSAWLAGEALPGAARWMELQAKEELEHGHKIMSYLLEREAPVKLGPIEAPPHKWKSALDVFERSYEHEKKVTGMINNLMATARSENDYATEIFLQWFVTEQVEEENAALENVRILKMAEGNNKGLFMIDRQLGQR